MRGARVRETGALLSFFFPPGAGALSIIITVRAASLFLFLPSLSASAPCSPRLANPSRNLPREI